MIQLSKHKDFKDEYCASVVKIGELFPIEGKDRIVKTLVNGLSIVIGKNDFQTGDVAVYCANETVIHELFLHLNNMYDDKELNIDKEQRGYVNKHGRIRCIKLGGVPSYGILLTPKSIATFLNLPVDVVNDFLDKHVGEDFDEINGERFVHVYVPPVKENKHVSKGDKRNAKLKRFKLLIDNGNFRFHYDTKNLNKEIDQFNPEDEVDISVKVHGTSACFSNILTYIPTNWVKRIWRKYILHKSEYDKDYNLIYSSRTVIKNEFINPKQKKGGYYGDDVWGYWAKRLDGLIPKDYCVYGEIVGFTPNGSVIQKGYDYGCSGGQSKLMVYRLTINGKEQEISEVIKFGEYLKKSVDDIMLYPILYHGTLKNLYPDLDASNHWHTNILELMKNESRFGMEQNEPLCHNKVPREGVCIRKCFDPISECFKLKTDAFRFREAKLVDKGEVDIEMQEGYSE